VAQETPLSLLSCRGELSKKEDFHNRHRLLIMKTTFSYFPGMFENPAPLKYYFKKSKNDLLGIKLIILQSELNVATF